MDYVKKSKVLEKRFHVQRNATTNRKMGSRVGKVKIGYHLKHQIPIMHRQFFRIVSQIMEYVKTYCNDLNFPFIFACRK